jgi:hypothetical protein
MFDNSTVTLEWRLPMGAGGMAAGMAHAQLKSKLDRIGKQHGFEISLYTTDERYRVRADFTAQQYTILCLQWQTDRDFLKWKRVSRFSL